LFAGLQDWRYISWFGLGKVLWTFFEPFKFWWTNFDMDFNGFFCVYNGFEKQFIYPHEVGWRGLLISTVWFYFGDFFLESARSASTGKSCNEIYFFVDIRLRWKKYNRNV
jgi:hypothetical protein